MSVRETLFWLQGTPVAHAISKSHHLVGAVLQVIHILGFISLLAAAVLLALRGMGLVLPGISQERLRMEMGRFLWIGLALTIGSGLLMFVSAPMLYFYNRAFDFKMVLLLVAVIAQLLLFRHARRAPPGQRQPAWTAAASLTLWFGIGIAGRAIGFV